MWDPVAHPQPIVAFRPFQESVVAFWHLSSGGNVRKKVGILRVDIEEKGLYDPLCKTVKESEEKECGCQAISCDAGVLGEC